MENAKVVPYRRAIALRRAGAAPISAIIASVPTPLILGWGFISFVLLSVCFPHLACTFLGLAIGLWCVAWLEIERPDTRIFGIKASRWLLVAVSVSFALIYLSEPSHAAFFLESAQKAVKELVTKFSGTNNTAYTNFIDGLFLLIRAFVIFLLAFLVVQVFNQYRADDEWKPLFTVLVIAVFALMAIEGLSKAVFG